MSPTSALPPLSHLQWRAPEWISAFGPLTKSILMDYFVLSPFFDHGSNNATLRMQIMFSRQGGAAGNPAGGLMDGLDEEGELKRFKGIEYVVVHDDAPGLFIIHKRDRQSPTQAYHILNDSIYEAPSLYQVVNERLLASLHALSTSLNALKANQPNWSTERGAGQWKIRSTPTALTQPSSAPVMNPLDVLGTQETKKRFREDETSTSRDEPEAVVLDPSSCTDETIATLPAEEGVQDLLHRPPESFNPLLFNALDRVARDLHVPIRLDESRSPLENSNGTLGEAETGKKENGGTASGGASAAAAAQRTKASSLTASGSGTKSGKHKVAQAANGKRIPRKAVQAQAAASGA